MCIRRRITVCAGTAITVGVLLLGAPSARGGLVNSGGWTVSWDKSLDEVVGVTPLSSADNLVSFVAHLQFTGGPDDSGTYEPVALTFQQTSLDARKLLVIEQEAVINQTSDAWDGYRFMLEPSAASGVQFDEKLTTASSHSFSIAPFTTRSFEQQGKELYVGGGALPAGPEGENVWNPGQFEGALYIDGAPKTGGTLRTFTLLQGPSASSIPLPAGGFTGLSVLGALGLGKWLRCRATARA